MNDTVVYIVDDEEDLRDAIEWLLHSVGLESRMFASGNEFLDRLDTVDGPGCIILDVRMPGKNGLDVQRELVERGCPLPVIILTGHGDAPMAARAIKDGAFDFIEKPFNNQNLLELVQKAIQESVGRIEVQRSRDAVLTRVATLSERERQVLELIVSGATNQDMADRLEISRRTVEVHRSSMMEKLAVGSVAELMRTAFTAGLIEKPHSG